MVTNKIFAGLLGLATTVLAFGAGGGSAQAHSGCKRPPERPRAGYIWNCNHWERARAPRPYCVEPRIFKPGYIWKCDHWERARASGPDVRDHRGEGGPVVHDHRQQNGPRVHDHRRWR